jgi:hypothetical protein
VDPSGVGDRHRLQDLVDAGHQVSFQDDAGGLGVLLDLFGP